MSSYEHIIVKEEVNERIDKLLSTQMENYSRSTIQTWIKKELVTVNGNKIKANYRCKLNDQIKWSIPKEKTLDLIPEKTKLAIIYEDDDLLVINKEAGMVVHPTNDHQTGTLVHALLHHTKNLSDLSGKERPGIVHRLDKNTGGLIVVAKNNHTHTELVTQFKENKVERKYEAIVHGAIEHETGLIDAPIGRDPSNRLRMAVVDGGKYARTHFQVLSTYNNHTYVSCQLETGRTHQIRVHMDYINHPIVGDPTYNKIGKITKSGQALYAQSLKFIHPRTNKWQHFEIGQPTYFKQVLNKVSENG